jgi:glycosyltransferase involved in cell wall biosynthesis
MKLSILLFCYNQEGYIQQAVESVLCQNIPFPFEIVVADDHSTDATRTLITALLEKTSVTYRMLPSDRNLGISRNYERGFAACKGDYIAVLEGDDYWTNPNRIVRLVAIMDARPDAVVVFNRKNVLYEASGATVCDEWPHATDQTEFSTIDMIIDNPISNMSTTLLRRQALTRLDSSLYALEIDDYMLGIALSEHGVLIKVKDPMTLYRVHSKGFFSGLNKKVALDRLKHDRIPSYNAYLNYRYDSTFRHVLDVIEEYQLKLDNPIFQFIEFIPITLRKGISKRIPKRFRDWFFTILYRLSN